LPTGTSAPIELELTEKEQLLGAVRACMQTLGDEKARELLPRSGRHCKPT
jgi:hypothetical protein